tara:strand:- start:293 stop:1342 length:1050 start_codon:yes stop_codon:yes gene_type:complete
MAFLDNSGDIILDAVLTDAGRQRMARGNFKIVKFAFGDEEINYNTFNGSHPSGSAFYDLEVMQTPILEAFTNNTSLMKSKLVTMTRNNILFMPVFKLNNNNLNKTGKAMSDFSQGYILLADTKTEKNDKDRDFGIKAGLLRGQGNVGNDSTRNIAVDQGIDSTEGGLNFRQPIPDDLVETAFLIRMDHRLLRLHVPTAALDGTTPITNQFIDDDGIASYYVVMGDGTTAVEGAPARRGGTVIAGPPNQTRHRSDILANEDDLTAVEHGEIFSGPLGSILNIYPRSSAHVIASDRLFNELGSTGTSLLIQGHAAGETISSYKYIDTLINVVGVTTGYSIDIPIRIVKGTF